MVNKHNTQTNPSFGAKVPVCTSGKVAKPGMKNNNFLRRLAELLGIKNKTNPAIGKESQINKDATLDIGNLKNVQGYAHFLPKEEITSLGNLEKVEWKKGSYVVDFANSTMEQI